MGLVALGMAPLRLLPFTFAITARFPTSPAEQWRLIVDASTTLITLAAATPLLTRGHHRPGDRRIVREAQTDLQAWVQTAVGHRSQYPRQHWASLVSDSGFSAAADGGFMQCRRSAPRVVGFRLRVEGHGVFGAVLILDPRQRP